MEINKIYNQDCIHGMKKIEDNSIATCITDPPYNYEFIGKNWDNEEIKRRINKVKKGGKSKEKGGAPHLSLSTLGSR